jgi:hypothetical protein
MNHHYESLLAHPPYFAVRLFTEQRGVTMAESDFKALGSTSDASDSSIL